MPSRRRTRPAGPAPGAVQSRDEALQPSTAPCAPLPAEPPLNSQPPPGIPPLSRGCRCRSARSAPGIRRPYRGCGAEPRLFPAGRGSGAPPPRGWVGLLRPYKGQGGGGVRAQSEPSPAAGFRSAPPRHAAAPRIAAAPRRPAARPPPASRRRVGESRREERGRPATKGCSRGWVTRLLPAGPGLRWRQVPLSRRCPPADLPPPFALLREWRLRGLVAQNALMATGQFLVLSPVLRRLPGPHAASPAWCQPERRCPGPAVPRADPLPCGEIPWWWCRSPPIPFSPPSAW